MKKDKDIRKLIPVANKCKVVSCEGERRHGSAYCQDCSDKNKKVI